MRQRLAVAQHTADLVRSGRCELGERRLQHRGTGAEDSELTAPVEEPGDRLEQEIHALLMGQAADHAGEQGVRRRRQPEPFLQCLLVQGLALERVDIVAGDEMRVGRRVPDHLVDTVDDARQIGRARPEQPVETHAVLGRLDLHGIGRADGGQGIGVVEPGLQEAQTAVILEPGRREGRGRQPQGDEEGRGELALKGEIVDGHHCSRPRPGPGRWSGIQGQIGGQQPRLPVVRMDDRRPPIRIGPAGERRPRPGQGTEAQPVVRPVGPVRPGIRVARPCEEGRRLEQINDKPPMIDAPQPAGSAGQLGELGRDHAGPGAGRGLEHRRIGGQQRAHLDARGGERTRQGPRHIGEPAGLDQGIELGRDRKDPHAVNPPHWSRRRADHTPPPGRRNAPRATLEPGPDAPARPRPERSRSAPSRSGQ